MGLVVAGTIAPVAAGDEEATFPGRVWFDDDGTIAAVTDPGWRQRAAQGIADGVRAYLTSR